MHLGNCAIPLEGGVEHVEAAVAPAAWSPAGLQRIAPVPDDTPQHADIRPTRVCIDMVKQMQITGAP
jgi:hypothetical protein